MNLLNTCKYSKIVYQDPMNSEGELTLKHSYQYIQDDETGADMYIIILNEKEIILSFRGSESAQDWYQTIKISKTPFLTANDCRVKVHSGFYEQYTSISQQIMNHIKENSKLTTIYCTGHSLGGALATIASIDIKLQFKHLHVKCYTFGAPRVGNNSFKKLFNNNVDYSARVVYNNDIVTKMPSCFRSYRHTNKKIKLKAKYRSYWRSWFDFSSITDHDIDNYIEAIKNLLE